MSNNWVDFKQLRRSINFADLLKYYGVEIKERKSGQHQGFCPLPNHQGGKKRSPSFSAHLKRGIFRCFSCQAAGNTIEFAVLMEGGHPKNPADLRRVALKLRDTFGAGTKAPSRPKAAAVVRAQAGNMRVVVNAPLDFALKRLDPTHPYLKERGFQPHVIEQFGLGFCSLGLFGGRIAIPIHNGDSQLIGYAGRLVNGAAINEENPRYLFPPRRERNGCIYEFRKALVVYNGNRICKPVEHLVVVESFTATWWLTQWGYPATVAVMGSDCSQEQARIITSLVAPDGCVWVFTDGDEAGAMCGTSILTKVAPYRRCRWSLLEDKQPTDCTPGDLAELLWPL